MQFRNGVSTASEAVPLGLTPGQVGPHGIEQLASSLLVAAGGTPTRST
jgi:hypothetical protein